MMSKRIGIVLPGKVGDIIICLPIAKYYHDLGYEIYWPLYNELIENFKSYINYVNFIPTYSEDRITESFQILKSHNCQILDLSFTSPGSWHNENTKNYLSQNEKSFDEFRYFLANVDFQKKWDLTIQRDHEKENSLYEKLVKSEKYCLIQRNSSDNKIEFDIDCSKYDGQIIDVLPHTNSVLDWIKLLENAERVILIESCFNNLIDQLKIKNNKQYLILKNGYYGVSLNDGHLKGMPRLKNDWIKI
jgi:hypothetical protein